MFSRRKVAKLLGGAPLGLAAMGSTIPAPPIGRASIPYPSSIDPPREYAQNRVHEPLMSKKAALRLLFKEKHIFDQFESALYVNKRNIDHIDHDLQSKKSFSMAAKITFQRQRDVARVIRDTTEDYESYRVIERITEEMVRKLMYPL